MARINITGGDEIPERPPGHSTADLGPSDTSDSGSDIAGPGLAAEPGIGMESDSGTSSDINREQGAGLDLGDADLDSDSDAAGTGEHKTVGRDSSIREGGDVAPDRITRDPGGLAVGEDPEGVGVTRKPGRKP